MQSKFFQPTENFAYELYKDLFDNVLGEFKELYNNDVLQLRNKIPPEEIWRFFVDGVRQNFGNELKAMFDELVANKILAKDDFNISINVLAVKIRQIRENGAVTPLFKDFFIRILKFIRYYDRIDLACPANTLKEMCAIANGWRSFEEVESGYLAAMISTFQEIFDFSKSLDTHYIKKLHAAALQEVQRTYYEGHHELKGPGKFRVDNFGYNPLGEEICEVAGMKEILQEIQSYDDAKDDKQTVRFIPVIYVCGKEVLSLVVPASIFKALSNKDKQEQFLSYLVGFRHANLKVEFYSSHDRENVDKLISFAERNEKFLVTVYPDKEVGKKVNRTGVPIEAGLRAQKAFENEIQSYLNEYQRDMAVAVKSNKHPLFRIIIIAKLIQKCERIHAFYDGNTRTYTMFLLNHLLMRNGFPPAILDAPLRSTGYSLDGFVRDIIVGMRNTLDLARGLPIFGIKTQDLTLTSEQQQCMAKVVQVEKEGRGCVL